MFYAPSTHPSSSFGVGTSWTEISPVRACWRTCFMRWPPADSSNRRQSVLIRRPERSASRVRASGIARSASTNPAHRSDALPQFPHPLWTKQSTLSNSRFRKQVVHHFFQIVRQPVIDWCGQSRLSGCRKTSRGRMSCIALRKMYLVVGRKNPLSSIAAVRFHATNSASSRSRKGTRTSTD